MSNESPKLCDASPLTDGELHVLAERHPTLEGFSAAAVLGSNDKGVIALVEALFGAFADGKDTRFGLTTLSAGERTLVAERRPEFAGHETDLVAATSDPAIAKVLDAASALFGAIAAAKAEVKEPVKDVKKEPAKKEAVAKEAKADGEPIVTPVIAAMAPAAVPAAATGDTPRAPWANRLDT